MIDKETQDQAWKCLPKKLREEAKSYLGQKGWGMTASDLLQRLFGEHNLTSDAEPEEMISVPRKKVQHMYAAIINDIRIYSGENPEMVGATDPILRERVVGMKAQLRRLFGSKCLPDETLSQNPAEKCDNKNPISINEPKFKRGEKVCYNGYVYEIEGLVGKNRYALKGLNFDLDEDMIEPYTEPTQTNDNMEEKEHRNLSQETANYDKEDEKYFCNNGSCPFNGVDYLEENQCDKVLCNKRVPKPMRWTPQIGVTIFWVNANLTVSQDRFNDFGTQRKRRAAGNEFKTVKEAEKFAEAVRKCLEEFHKKNQ